MNSSPQKTGVRAGQARHHPQAPAGAANGELAGAAPREFRAKAVARTTRAAHRGAGAAGGGGGEGERVAEAKNSGGPNILIIWVPIFRVVPMKNGITDGIWSKRVILGHSAPC